MTDPNLDWQAAIQRLYNRKSAERPLQEGDPRKFRDAAAELTQRGHGQTKPGENLPIAPTPDPAPKAADRALTPIAKPPGLDNLDTSAIVTPLETFFKTSFLEHQIQPQQPAAEHISLIPGRAAWEILQRFGPDAAYLFLAIAVRASLSDRPWRSTMTLKGTELLHDLGWEKLPELSLAQKLQKIEELMQFICSLSVVISYVDEQEFSLSSSSLWTLDELSYRGALATTIEAPQSQQTPSRAGVPTDLTIVLRPGHWVQEILADEPSSSVKPLQDYSWWATSILKINPSRKRLAARLAIFVTVMGQLYAEGHYRVGDLLEQIEDEKALAGFYKSEETRTRLFVRWNNTLHSLKNLGWEIGFDAATYPESLRPAWSLGDEEASVQSSRFPNWFETWIEARLTIRPGVCEAIAGAPVKGSDRKKASVLTRPKGNHAAPRIPAPITGQVLDVALTLKGWSKAHLAGQLKMDRSMVTHWVKGTRPISPEQRKRLWKLLAKELRAAQKLKY